MVIYFSSESLYKLDVELGHLGIDREAFKPIYFLLLQVEQLDQCLHVYFFWFLLGQLVSFFMCPVTHTHSCTEIVEGCN